MTRLSRSVLALLTLAPACGGTPYEDAASAEPTLRDAPNAADAGPQPPTSVELRVVRASWRVGEHGTAAVRGGPLDIVVRDADDETVATLHVDQQATDVALELPSPGYFTLEAVRGRSERSPRTAVAVVPPPGAAGPLRLGVNTHFGQRGIQDGALEMLSNLGVDHVRDELGWRRIEASKGVYAFPPEFDAYTQAVKDAGLGLFFVASYGNAVYGPGRYPVGPVAAAAYGEFLARVVERYSDRLEAVEILNEPNVLDPVAEYLPTLQAGFAGVRRSSSLQPVFAVGGAGIGGGMNPSFARSIYAAGGAGHCNGFSQHPYMAPHPPDTGYPARNAPAPVANLDTALAASAAIVKPAGQSAWISEIGWPAPLPNIDVASLPETDPNATRAMVSERKQAAFLARTILGVSRYPHVAGLTLYDFQDDGPDPLKREHRFGVVRQDLTPKPAYVAVAVTASFLREKTFVRRIASPSSRLSANVYRAADGATWLAFWTLETTVDRIAATGRGEAAALPSRYMDEELTAAVTVAGGAITSAIDWQGRSLGTTGLVAASLPTFIRVAAAPETVSIDIP